MAQAEIEKEIALSAEHFLRSIRSYENYPGFVDGCSGAEVLEKDGDRTRVRYTVSLMKEISYILDHVDEGDVMSWSLVESDFLKKNSGSWKVAPAGEGRCQVAYEIDIEFKFPVPGMILKKLVKGSLPKMVQNFEDYARRTNH